MSDKTKHTPGPWVNLDGMLYDSNGEFFVASAVGLGLGSDSCDGVRLANARLIAVAPELLDVVKGFRSKLETYVNVYPGDKELRRLLSNCDAAIAKATGETA